jgi:putative ABC transport system permease protein
MHLAQRNLLKDKTRLALSISGVALAVMLILILSGFLNGLYRQFAAYLEHTPGSLVVAQEGVSNLLSATSLLPADAAESASAIEGVEAVAPILSQFVILDLHGKKQPAYLVGYDPNPIGRDGGGPWQLSAGREPAGDDEVVFDRVLAERHNLVIGDRIEVMGQPFTIVGLSEGTTTWMTSFFFMRKMAAETLLRAPGATSFLLVTTAGEADTEAVRGRLDGLAGMDALLKSVVIANDRKLFTRVFGLPLRLMVGISFLVGTLVVGLVSYTATIERQREYGVLKAIGITNWLLYRIVTWQALLIAAVGSLLGVGLAFGAAELIVTLRPQFLITLEAAAIGQALLAGIGMALLAALFPARAIAGVAPAEVFRR